MILVRVMMMMLIQKANTSKMIEIGFEEYQQLCTEEKSTGQSARINFEDEDHDIHDDDVHLI